MRTTSSNGSIPANTTTTTTTTTIVTIIIITTIIEHATQFLFFTLAYFYTLKMKQRKKEKKKKTKEKKKITKNIFVRSPINSRVSCCIRLIWGTKFHLCIPAVYETGITLDSSYKNNNKKKTIKFSHLYSRFLYSRTYPYLCLLIHLHLHTLIASLVRVYYTYTQTLTKFKRAEKKFEQTVLLIRGNRKLV